MSEDEIIDKAGDKLAHLEESRETILAILRDAYEKGPKTKPFDETKEWNRIFQIAGLHGVQNVAAEFPKQGKANLRRYLQIAGALQKARDLLAEEDEADAGSTIMDIGAAIGTLEQLARAANESAEDIKSRNGRGHPSGGSQLPDQIIVALAAVFRNSTGTVPTIPHTRPITAGRIDQDTGIETAFGKFVVGYMRATDRHLADGTIINAMRQARDWSLKPVNQEWAPSPFKA